MSRAAQRRPATGVVRETPPAVEEIEEDEEGETTEEEVEAPHCFVGNHAGITAKAQKELVRVTIPVSEHLGADVWVCAPHNLLLVAAKEAREAKLKSEENAPHGSCHICGQPVGIHPTSRNGDYTTWWVHMNNIEEKCHETCPCTAIAGESDAPVGRQRITIWMKPIEA